MSKEDDVMMELQDRTIQELQAENKRLKEKQRISNSCVPCMYLGGDCCGIMYWANNGKVLCNECNKEFKIVLIGDKDQALRPSGRKGK